MTSEQTLERKRLYQKKYLQDPIHLAKHKQRVRDWEKRNVELRQRYTLNWRRKNYKHILEYARRWRENNREEYNAYARNYRLRKNMTSPNGNSQSGEVKLKSFVVGG